MPEDRSDEAVTLLEKGHDLLAPDLLWPEAANILWKKVARRELTAGESRSVLRALHRVPIEIAPSASLVDAAFEIALAHGRTVYDGVYVALAVAREVPLVTADDRLARALAAGPLRRRVFRLGAAYEPGG